MRYNLLKCCAVNSYLICLNNQKGEKVETTIKQISFENIRYHFLFHMIMQ